MAVIKWSQLPIANTISQSAYVPIVDLNQPVGSQNQIILASQLITQGSSNVTLDGSLVSSLDPNVFGINGNGTTLTFSNIADVGGLSGDTTILIVNNNYTYKTTIAELASYIVANYL